ncbi:dynein axonemal intermediate chain 4-like isoform X2 [Venturia canescens]|uniref:dynein axonemal intermediate chain 4-like isoform X2 n=1 Tax=Venturia canescens TaxID=32260 RepID=UPI001C9CE11C|nr:dynein axonemal intermediate chain 4-like isoform X2 [Venturia canescens]
MPHRRSDATKKATDRGRNNSLLQIRPIISERTRRELLRGVVSAFQHRMNINITENGVDLTPKFLTDSLYPPIEEKQLTALDTIGLSHNGSMSQLTISSPGNETLRSSSLSLVKSSSMYANVLPSAETIQSILSAQGPGDESLQDSDNDQAPSQFCLSRYDSGIFYMKSENETLTIKETETFFLFEMPQLTADLQTPEGLMVQEANERYEYVTVGGGSNRKLIDAETQTPRTHTKPRSTYIGPDKRHNRGTFVNNWVMYDTYENPESTVIEKELKTRSINSVAQIIAAQIHHKKLMHNESYQENESLQDDLNRIFNKARKVSCHKWNPVNADLLAAGYGTSQSEKDGLMLIWCMKNPSQPDRIYRFPCPISSADWSNKKPNQLAIGFHDGSVIVIDVSKKDLVVLRKSSRLTSPTYSPHWQVQWWVEDEQYDYQEHIYTSNEDGRIVCYRTGEDFTPSEIMRIPRIENQIGGVARTNECNLYNIPISQNPGAVLLRRHPSQGPIYFVGTDEGCVHRCSTNYLHQHIDSFLAHDGPVYSFEFSPFCDKIFLTCGADWCTRIWVDGITEPLVTLSTHIACVRGASWCPINSTVIASIVNDEICIWDIKRKIYRPSSVTSSTNNRVFVSIDFTKNGKQLVAADTDGDIHIYTLEGMPFPPLDQTALLVKSIEKALVTKPELLRKLKKLGTPF